MDVSEMDDAPYRDATWHGRPEDQPGQYGRYDSDALERFSEAPVTALERALDSISVPDTRWQLPALARGMLRGYDSRWRSIQHEFKLIACEETYEAPLMNLHTGHPSRTFRLAGKLDKHCVHTTGTTIIDHKTTSFDISDLTAPYWRQLTIESQPSHYELLLHLNGFRVDLVIWDVARKPAIRPRKLSKKELSELSETGKWYGVSLSAESLEWIGREGSENAELYEIRVSSECSSNPNRYFARQSAKRSNEELAEYAVELWDVATELREARKHNRHYRNSGSCFNFGTPCRFLGVCSGYDSIDSENWYRVPQVHNELTLEGDGKDLLTNSRLRCFQTCRRKHYYEYELGVRRVDEEEREALFFGSLWGSALDVYWKYSTTKG